MTCEHTFKVLGTAESGSTKPNVRTVQVRCSQCGFTRDILTTRTDEEIADAAG